MRVENVKGAVWTVDEAEFCKRRPQRCVTGYVWLPTFWQIQIGGTTKKIQRSSQIPYTRVFTELFYFFLFFLNVFIIIINFKF